MRVILLSDVQNIRKAKEVMFGKVPDVKSHDVKRARSEIQYIEVLDAHG
jgi:hypothetical protein